MLLKNKQNPAFEHDVLNIQQYQVYKLYKFSIKKLKKKYFFFNIQQYLEN